MIHLLYSAGGNGMERSWPHQGKNRAFPKTVPQDPSWVGGRQSHQTKPVLQMAQERERSSWSLACPGRGSLPVRVEQGMPLVHVPEKSVLSQQLVKSFDFLFLLQKQTNT